MGTRGSPLALAQSRQFANALKAAHNGLQIEERIIRTTGDKQQSQPLPEIGGKGVFTLEIEDALRNRDIDFAVHSLKDLPPDLPAGLCIAAIPRRASANDVCILNSSVLISGKDPEMWSFLPLNARVGTSSLRRRAQLLNRRPDLLVSDIRGNIDTRLRKMQGGDFDAIILAAAGLERLGISESCGPSFVLNERDFIPAPGQGALAIEARAGDEETLRILRALEDKTTRAEIDAERALMRELNAGCSTPLGARAVAKLGNEEISLRAAVLSPDGAQRFFVVESGHASQAKEFGVRVAEKLRALGADEILSTQ